ncbi:maleylpyruvate isomerase family mycothiol-dependent enzyme [Mycobacterium hubeiense]|uniref:maleylpyruvate isomerase family mycothiol-dependent enzyme n=1 Tax=Mycobacterium hubeiense TaxID=1867256 RepID=UPI001E35F14D|nr:maleylpyruvate isomerase family mycothiol-dependent enzyme [Mycobacterium sp. QGD 101]
MTTDSRLYRETMDRITALVSGLDEKGWATVVPACPEWSVRDVLAHLAAVADDWASGRLAGPATDEQTAAQVARFSGVDIDAILATWADASARLHELAETTGLEPPLGDIVIHEHDLRGALDRPGARDSDGVRRIADELLAMLEPPVPLRVRVEDDEYRSGPDGEPELALTTTRFETLRWRTGRRSRSQLAAMDWSGDPTGVLDHLYLFGPAQADLVE